MYIYSCTAKLAQEILRRITRSLSTLDGLILLLLYLYMYTCIYVSFCISVLICINVIYFSVPMYIQPFYVRGEKRARQGYNKVFIIFGQIRLFQNSTIRAKRTLFFVKYTAVKMNSETCSVCRLHCSQAEKKILQTAPSEVHKVVVCPLTGTSL